MLRINAFNVRSTRKMASTRRMMSDARFFYNDVYEVVLPEKHKFPMTKYGLVRETLTHQLRAANTLSQVDFQVSPLASIDEICTTHCPQYVSRFFSGNMTPQENRRVGFPWTISGVQRCASSVGGTVAAMRSVCTGEARVSAHLAGGTHHAFYDRGEGFCVFSDIAVASNLALKEFHDIKRILIIDLDVHQGNGNAVLFEDNPSVYTFSMHCKANYFSKIRQSDLDVEVEIGATDDTYLSLLAQWLPKLLHEQQPDLVFYQAGVDTLGTDRLGKLGLSQDGLALRNRMVYEEVRKQGAKLVVTMGGGYPTDLDPLSNSYKTVIQAHVNVYKDCIPQPL